MALLLGGTFPAGAAEEAQAFYLGDGQISPSSSCSENGWAIASSHVFSPTLGNGSLYICGERILYPNSFGGVTHCWEGIRGAGQLLFGPSEGTGEVYDLTDVTIKRVYADAARQADVGNPYQHDTVSLFSQVNHFLVEGRSFRRSDKHEGLLRLLIPVGYAYHCEPNTWLGVHLAVGALTPALS